ncbi:glutamine ABC transporter substrate-binding protein [Vibrio sp. UCD-FRSSP16_10]|uniref:transporter substrate-binding domain-containing protein n=1 Tax=unclassified Vibrio TaxID=2614977 RepID=UPI0007FFD1D0|nr:MULTISPECIES: transporter substrate-binding domain-containing protein [unclassified Vibrio]OBT09416.1 glutamine ABC transporter substrate-binding protein [Vibrio sp. UCD-FRSSP16_30]OBT22095.1 glutamine ABC transporter substrate-binding protein [Vibrio sp. UCD-FRSSP16_10]
MKKISITLAMLLVVATSSTAFAKEKVYKIATDAAYAPFAFKKDGAYTGIDVDVLAAVAKTEGFKYELTPMNFNGIIPGVVSGQLDGAIAGMTITEKRAHVLDFSEGYYESGVIPVVTIDSKIASKADLKNKRYAVKKGTTSADWANANRKQLNSSIRYFDDSASMFQEVINGNADVAFEDYPVIAYKISLDKTPVLKLVGEKLTTAKFGFGVKKGQNAELLKMFNEGLAKIKANGTYEKILSTYQ